MANNQQQDKDKRPRAYFDTYALTLWGQPVNSGAKSPQFSINVGDDGRVNITVRTGNPDDKDKSSKGDGDVIRISFNRMRFNTFVDKFGEVVRSKTPLTYHLAEQVQFRWDKEKRERVRMETPRDGITLHFGKGDDGIIRMTLEQYNRSKIEFDFVPQRTDFLFKHGDGTNFTDAEMAGLAQRAYLKELDKLQDSYVASRIWMKAEPELYQPPYKPDFNKGGNGGGNKGSYSNNNGGGNGGYSNNSAPAPKPQAEPAGADDDFSDDDVPY